MEKPKKVPLNRLVLPETFEKVKELAAREDLTDGAVIDRAVRLFYGADAREVSEGLTAAQTEILDEMLELVRSVPDREVIKEVVKEAGRELRAEKVADRVALSSVTVSDVKMMGLLGPHATATDYENYMASQPQSSVMPRSLAELREAGLISEGMPSKKAEGQIPCTCKHSGCRFGDGKFLGTRKGQDLCSNCVEKGHRGEPRDCKSCFDDMGPT